jgi:hypothetical protein
MIRSLILEGTSTSTGSFERKEADNIKKVTSKKAKSTIGVMSMDGVLLGILILGISLKLNVSYFSNYFVDAEKS